MGMKKEIEVLIEQFYTRGKDGSEIANRLITAGIQMMWDQGDLDESARICPTEDGYYLAKRTESPATAPESAVEPVSGVTVDAEPPELVVSSVAAIRSILGDLMDDDDFRIPNDKIGHQFEAIDQLLDKVVIVTDADIPAYIRTKAEGARHHAGRGKDAGDYGHYATMLDALADEIQKSIHVGLEDPAKALREITDMIGKANVDAGWWTEQNVDLRKCEYTKHVVAGKLMLVCSEVSEGMEGWRKSQKTTVLMDDHLPERPMLEVELADAHIRLFDLGANVSFPNGRRLDVPGAIMEKLAYNAVRPDHKKENREAEGGKSS